MAAETRTKVAWATSVGRALGSLPVHQAAVVLGGLAALAVGVFSLVSTAQSGAAFDTPGLALLLAGAMALVGHAVWRWEPREGMLVTAVAGLLLVVLGGEAIGTPTGLIVLGGAGWAFLSRR